MNQELIKKILFKIAEIEAGILQVKRWLENGTDKDMQFLAEINQPVPLRSELPENDADIPDFAETTANVEESRRNCKDELTERFDLEPEKEEPKDLTYIERDSKEFLALVEFSMLKNWQKSHVDNFLMQKGLKLSEKTESHLNELRKFGAMVKAGEMDVPALLDQSCLSDAERIFLTEKYIF